MLKYNIIAKDDKKIVYRYYPEGENEFGVISVNIETGECSIDELSSNDEHQIYAMKMISRIKELNENDSYEEEGIVAWY